MATHNISIINSSFLPDATGQVFFEPYNVKATVDRWRHNALIFSGGLSTKNGGYGIFDIPPNYVGSAKLIVIWTSLSTSGDVEWDFEYRAIGGDDAESFDQSGEQEAVNQNDTAPTGANRRLRVEISLTSANFAAEDTVEFQFSRDQTDAGDTMSGAAILKRLLFSYSDE